MFFIERNSRTFILMLSRTILLSFLMFLSLLWWGCGEQQVLETCRMSAITNTAGDTLMTLEYEDSLLVRIDQRNPSRIRRFQYENGFLIREESFGQSGILQRIFRFLYTSDSLNKEIIEYTVGPDGEWRAIRIERYSEFRNKLPTVSRQYYIENGQEFLSSYHQYSWLNQVLVQDKRWEQIHSSSSALRVAEKTVYIYDSRPSPWPDLPSISPWLRTRVYASITKTLFSYLPDGTVQETVFTQRSDNRFDRQAILQESVITDFSGNVENQTIQYLCTDILP